MNEVFLGLDPLYWTHLKVCIQDVLDMQSFPGHQSLYLFEGHAIRNVEIYGVVVAIERTHAVTTITVDDSTGTMPCVSWKSDASRETKIVLGKAVRVLGRVSQFKGERQVTIHDISIVSDPNRELVHIVEAILLRRDVYKKPYQIPVEIADNAEKLAEELVSRGADVHTSSQSANQSNIVDEDGFCEALLSYLREHCTDGPFSYDTHAREDDSLKEIARRVLEMSNGIEPSHIEITKLFARCMMDLERKGYLIEAAEYGGQMYRLLHDKDLAVAIKKIIKDSSQHLTLEHGGILQEFIVNRIQDLPMYGKLPRSRIIECLDEMTKNSILYTTGKREYKLLC